MEFGGPLNQGVLCIPYTGSVTGKTSHQKESSADKVTRLTS
jgi:hypothetical protein